MTHSKTYRTETYDCAVAALQTLLNEEGPAQVYRACGDAVAYLEQKTSPCRFAKEAMSVLQEAPRQQKLLLTIDEALPIMGGISLSTFQREVKLDRIQVVHLGRRVLVPMFALQDYVRRLSEE